MKVLVNGGLNLSVLDGWWAEAYAPGLGWAIAGDTTANTDDGDARDAETLFHILESEVIPLFYDRDAEGLPRAWLERVRASLSRLTPTFSAIRMVREYTSHYYEPAGRELARRLAEGGAVAKTLESWARRLTTRWQALRFGHVEATTREASSEISVEVYLDNLEPGDVTVELFAEPASTGSAPVCVQMHAVGPLAGTSHGHLFSATVPADRPVSDYTLGSFRPRRRRRSLSSFRSSRGITSAAVSRDTVLLRALP